MPKQVKIGERPVGEGCPIYVIAEIGINHNGDLQIAKKLIDTAFNAGCDAVKFQKRTPQLCVPEAQRDILRETPWGLIPYIEYREKIEFMESEYSVIDQYCKEKGIDWFASCWDAPSVDFMEKYSPICHKVPSSCLTDDDLLRRINATGRPMIVSTGMSTMEQIEHAVSLLDPQRLFLAHCTSSYPSRNEEINLRMIHTLKEKFDVPIGYSGHEVGLQVTLGAAALGACFVERHITLDRAMWGSDHGASVEPWGLMRLVRDIRVIELAIGDGVKKVYDSEVAACTKLRRKT